jgi:23S rRNA (uracil1939-C5)-methyltransferase
VSRRRKSKQVFEPEQGVVRDVTAEGNGVIAGDDGKTIFVDGALTGEHIIFQRRKQKRRYDEADLVEVLNPSPHRVTPKCDYFLNCGGCTWQHLASDQQILMKQNVLLQAFSRLGGVTPKTVMPPLQGESWGYRRRARFTARYVDGKERMLVGFSERGKPYVADMTSCETVHPQLSDLLPKLQKLIGSMDIKRQVPQIEASVGEAETSLVFRVLDEPGVADIARFVAFAEAESVTVLLQRKGPETITQLLSEAAPDNLFFSIPDFDIRLEFGPVDFIQVNHELNLRMIQQAVDWLQPKPTDRVLDLFCGLGTFTLPLARLAAAVTGVEGEVRSVEGARANAERNGITNAEFYVTDLFDTGLKGAWMKQAYDIVLLDPPRAGAAEIMPVLKRIKAAKVLYVSCHPGTLARDSKTLVDELGYKLVQAGVIDMFPQTGHVESMALFEKNV